MDTIKIYGIEEKWTYYGTMYRYYSKYNSARGSWQYSSKDARKEGEEHSEIIRALIGSNVSLAQKQEAKEEI